MQNRSMVVGCLNTAGANKAAPLSHVFRMIAWSPMHHQGQHAQAPALATAHTTMHPPYTGGAAQGLIRGTNLKPALFVSAAGKLPRSTCVSAPAAPRVPLCYHAPAPKMGVSLPCIVNRHAAPTTGTPLASAQACLSTCRVQGCRQASWCVCTMCPGLCTTAVPLHLRPSTQPNKGSR
jgi:hypothetical protein